MTHVEKPTEPPPKEAFPIFSEPAVGSEKRIVISLVALFGIIATAVLILLYVVPYYGFSRISVHLPLIMAILTALVGGVLLGSLGLLAAVFTLGRDVSFSRRLRSVAIKLLLPILVGLGRLAGFRREQVQHAFVAVNNELVLAQCRNGSPPRSVLLLMPHCLQDKDCLVKITHRVENCKRCGTCSIKDLLGLAEKYGVRRENPMPLPGISERAVFVTDMEGKVAFARIYDLGEVPPYDDILEVLHRLNEKR